MRLLMFASLFALSSLLACSGGDSNNNNNNNNQTVKECENPKACWKKICTQSDETEYRECIQKRVNTQIPNGEQENHKPEYLTCTAENKCKDIPTDTLGGGKVSVTLKPADVRIQWIRLMIFDSVDMDGKAITCKSLKEMATGKPESLMESKLRRYWPPRDADQPITTQVLEQQGRSLPLLFGTIPPTVPAGKHVFVIQGFCNPTAGGSPKADTMFKWWFCKEGVATEKGEKNDIEVDFDTSQHPACPPG